MIVEVVCEVWMPQKERIYPWWYSQGKMSNNSTKLLKWKENIWNEKKNLVELSKMPKKANQKDVLDDSYFFSIISSLIEIKWKW